MYRPTDRQTDKIYRDHVYVGLAQARPNYDYVYYTGSTNLFTRNKLRLRVLYIPVAQIFFTRNKVLL